MYISIYLILYKVSSYAPQNYELWPKLKSIFICHVIIFIIIDLNSSISSDMQWVLI